MKNLFGVTREYLEEYFLSSGEKSLKQHKYLNGCINIKSGI